jgi:solute carrier family 24 (sodium/potassium/calcium exchanger), member 6
MSESMAGVTFLALGNGSPDLFSTFAAMRVGSGSLAIGELIGAAFFISSVVAGSMAIVNPFKVSRKSFLRDAIFFAGAVAFSVGLLADGKITTWETSAMIAYYVLYVAFVVVATWYWRKRSSRRRQESRARYTFARPEEGTVEEDEDEEGLAARESTALIGDVTDLENALEDEDEDEPELEAEYANIQHRMSIVRPTLEIRTPSHIHSNIRPSLFGALEVHLH